MKIIDAVKDAGSQVERTLSGKTDAVDILAKLKQEHEEVANLLGKLVDSDSAATRKSLLKKIKSALVPHVRAEEKVVYNAIIARKEKQSKVDGEEGYFEHGLADKMLSSLGKINNAASPEFTAGAKVLKELIEHHVEEEEHNVWRDVREHFDNDERIEMNKKFEAEKKKVKAA